jgi:DNA-binding transcriptional MerR regulator
MSDETRFTIGELADGAGVTPRTIRYYTAEGLLPPPDTRGRYALYGADHLNRLLLIARLKDAYLPLGEIKARMERLSAGQVERLLVEYAGQPGPSSSAADYVAQVLATSAVPPPAARALAEAPSSYGAGESGAAAAVPIGFATLPSAAAASPPTAEAALASSPAPSIAPARAGLLKRLVPLGRDATAPVASAEETWQRVTLASGVELHVREPLPPDLHERVARLIERAHELLDGE